MRNLSHSRAKLLDFENYTTNRHSITDTKNTMYNHKGYKNVSEAVAETYCLLCGFA